MSNDHSETRRYLAVYLPLLPVERLKWQNDKAPEPPYALIEKHKGALILAACDEKALALGLGSGLPLADARARVPELSVFPHDPSADQALLDRMADDCGRYTPMVATDPPDGLLLDISGCTHIWSGEAALVDDLANRFKNLGFTCRIEPAGTPDKAKALAKYGNFQLHEPRDVRQIPVRALDLDPDRLNALRRSGLHTIGDLAIRPRRALAARLGVEAIAKLERVLGVEDIRINPRRHSPALTFVRRFAEPIGYSDLVLAVLQELAFEASKALCERGEGGRRFVATLYRSDGDVRRLGIDTGVPNRDPALVVRLFNERIASLADPLDPGFGYDVIRLDVPFTERLTVVQDAFGRKEASTLEITDLLDQLAARLGAACIRRFVAGDAHIPEKASTCEPVCQTAHHRDWPAPEVGEPPLRPLHLFSPPHRIDVALAQAPDGPPQGFVWRRRQHNVVLAEGPERIAPEWWLRKAGFAAGQGGLTRDYFRVEDERGCRFWLFRHGLYGEIENPGWYLHGLFA